MTGALPLGGLIITRWKFVVFPLSGTFSFVDFLPEPRCNFRLSNGPPAPRRSGLSRLASVSRALDFGPAGHAPAFALPGPPRNRAHVSSEHISTAPALRRCAVRYWDRRAYGIFHWPSPAIDMQCLGGSWLRTWGVSPGCLPMASPLTHGLWRSINICLWNKWSRIGTIAAHQDQ
jgi:hypothetical protein